MTTMQRWSVRSESEVLAFYDAAFVAGYRYAARLTHGDRAAAEDLVQDAFVRLVRSARDGTVTDVGIGWIIQVIRHRFVDGLRSGEREDRRMRLVSSTPVHVDDVSSVEHLLSGLSDRERAALIFRYVDDLPVAEVATLLGSTVRATESLLQRAKRNARGSESAS